MTTPIADPDTPLEAAEAELHVIFGTGSAGRAVMTALLARGKRVRMVNRSGLPAGLPHAVELLGGDAADRQFARRASAGAAVVYQCLAPAYNRWPELFPRLQAGLIEGASSAGAKLVALENLYMYGPTGGRPLHERRPASARARKGRVRAEMTEALMKAHGRGRVRATIGRASDLFGPGVGRAAMGERVFRAADSGAAAPVHGDLDLLHTYSYAPDVGTGLAILGERDEALGQIFHLPNPETVTARRFLEMIYEEAGHPLKVRNPGRLLFRLQGLWSSETRELGEMTYLFEEPLVVRHTKFLDAFGDISRPLRDAIRETVDWYRSNRA